MSPDLHFILLLALRMAVAAAFVVTASFITERAGAVVGALIATLPISAGPSYVFLALDHDAAFIAEGALASFPINAVTMFFCLTYVVLAQRRSAMVSVGGAIMVWIAFAALERLVPWSLTTGLIANAIAFAICIPAFKPFQHVKMPLITRRWYDIPLRAGMVATLVTIVVALSRWVGPVRQRHDRAVSGGADQHDADPASAHRRPGNGGDDRQWRMGHDGIWPRDCGASSRRDAVGLGRRAQPCARHLRVWNLGLWWLGRRRRVPVIASEAKQSR